MRYNEKSKVIEPEGLIQFCEYQFNFDNNELLYQGETVELQHKPSEILSILLRSPGQLVTREDIIQKIWGNQVVDFDQNINFCIKCIRKALSDDPRKSRFVQTIPRKGYRFIATVTLSGSAHGLGEKTSLGKVFSTWYYMLAIFLIMAYVAYYFVQTKNEKHTLSNEIIDNTNQDLKRAYYLLDKGDHRSIQTSIDIFKRIADVMKSSAEAYAGFAIATMLSSNAKEQQQLAIEYAQQAYNKNSQSGSSNLAMGMVEFYLHWNMPQAQSFLEQATRFDPQSIRAWHELSVIQTIRGDLTAAGKSIERALAIDPGRVQEIFHAGWFYLASEEYDKALDQCLKSIEISPSHRYSHLCVIDAALKLDLNQTAHKHMISYMELLKVTNPSVQEIKNSNDDERAQMFFKWRLKYLQEYGVNNFLLAIAHAQVGNDKQAITSLQKAIENNHMMVPTAWAFNQFGSLRKTKEFTAMMEAVVTR